MCSQMSKYLSNLFRTPMFRNFLFRGCCSIKKIGESNRFPDFFVTDALLREQG